jgi:hypothetical protein
MNDSFMNIISYKNPLLNNHILNTLLMKLSSAMLGVSELSLRLPNILAHLLYLVFTFRIFNRYGGKNAMLFFLLMNASPFLIDFFSLARGYGLAIGLMTAGFYFICRYLEEQKNKYYLSAMLFMAFAALANFALLNLVLLFMFMRNVLRFTVYRQKITLRNLWQANYINLLIFAFLLGICYEPLRKLIQLKMLTTGGMNGFWFDTVESSIRAFAYNVSYKTGLEILCRILVCTVTGLFFIRLIGQFFRRREITLTYTILLFSGGSFFLLVLSSIVQHFLMNTPFMETRFALFLYPLFMLITCFIILDYSEISNTIYARVATSTIVLVFAAHTLSSLNISWYHEWKYDRYTKTVIGQLKEIKDRDSIPQIVFGATWYFYPAIEFYVKKDQLDWIYMNYSDPRAPGNYYYWHFEEYIAIPREEVELIKNYDDIQTYLVKWADKAGKASNVELRACNGTYIGIDSVRPEIIRANSEKPGRNENFVMTRMERDLCAFRTNTGKFLSFNPFKPNSPVSGIGDRIGGWETFRLIKLREDTVAFLASNGKFLSLYDKDSQLYALSTHPGKNEKFRMIKAE